jgi:hypothetical protein
MQEEKSSNLARVTRGFVLVFPVSLRHQVSLLEPATLLT